MEITLIWSWFSFVVGFITPVILLLIWAVVVAVKQSNQAKKKATENWDNVDKFFQQWGGRNNG
jgi:hypothetical protein